MAPLLRLATRDDAAAIAAIYAPICRETAICFELEPPDAAEMARRIDNVLARLPWLVCVEGDTVLGYAYASPYKERAAYQWTLESSIYVAAEARGRGVARALYTALFDLVAAQGYCSIIAGITLPNAGSVGLHESLGFTPYGRLPAAGYKFGAWHDIGYWRRELRPLDGPPPDLLPLAAVIGRIEGNVALAAPGRA